MSHFDVAFIQDVAARLSMLKNGVEVLKQHENKYNRLSEVAELVNSTEEHAIYLQLQAAVVEK